MVNKFNVRVYGILHQADKILVSDEYIKGKHITKFPGGGLEFGEGAIDCVIREFKEELDLTISIVKHFYTTDFFVASAFDSNSQIISVYYLVKSTEKINFKISETAHNYIKKPGAQSFRWIDTDKISDSDFTLIIDKKVGDMLALEFKK